MTGDRRAEDAEPREKPSDAPREIDNRPYNIGFRDGWELAHEPAACGHARANYKDPKFGTPDYRGQERCEFCDALSAAKAAAR